MVARHKCFCDTACFPQCPGHGPTGLVGLKTRSKPIGQNGNVERAKRWVRLLRPDSTEAEVEKHARSKTRWQVCAWHFEEGQFAVEPAAAGRGKVIRGSPAKPAQEATLGTEVPVAPGVPSAPWKPAGPVRVQPPPQKRPKIPQVGQRLAVRDGDSMASGTVNDVSRQLTGRGRGGQQIQVTIIRDDSIGTAAPEELCQLPVGLVRSDHHSNSKAGRVQNAGISQLGCHMGGLSQPGGLC